MIKVTARFWIWYLDCFTFQISDWADSELNWLSIYSTSDFQLNTAFSSNTVHCVRLNLLWGQHGCKSQAEMWKILNLETAASCVLQQGVKALLHCHNSSTAGPSSFSLVPTRSHTSLVLHTFDTVLMNSALTCKMETVRGWFPKEGTWNYQYTVWDTRILFVVV